MSKNSITTNHGSYETNMLLETILETARYQQTIINGLSSKLDSLDKILQSNSVAPVDAGEQGDTEPAGPAGADAVCQPTYFTKITLGDDYITETTNDPVGANNSTQDGSILIPHMTEDFTAEENPHRGSWTESTGVVDANANPVFGLGADASQLVDNNSMWSCPKTGFYVIHFQVSVTSFVGEKLKEAEIQVICPSRDPEKRTIGIGGTNWGNNNKGDSVAQMVNTTCMEKIEEGEEVQFNVKWSVRRTWQAQNQGVILGKEGTGVIIWELN